MKTKQRLTTCFNAGALLFVAVAARADIPPLLPAPAPQQVIVQLSATDQWLSAFNRSNRVDAAADSAASADEVSLEDIRALLQRARETGDQRLLGQALHFLNQMPTPTTESHLLRATALQALHRFDPALDELQFVLQREPGNAQAWLLQATLHSVRGDYAAAQKACGKLLGKVPALLSGSCSSSVQARQGQAQRAYALLAQLYEQTARALNDPAILHHAQVSLADIADQLGNPAAVHWWALAQQSRPGDLYTRIGATRNAFHRGAHAEVVALTENADDIDALALLRTLSLQQLGNPAALTLRQQLVQRLDLARERGDTLHGRDQAAILLDLLQRPDEALAIAQQNWQEQREPEDTALLLRAALAAQRPDIYRATCDWLQQRNQWHVRYPVQSNDFPEPLS
ncbi:MAG: tetratricopeptide repeat protein [Pseudomonadota bacterium]